MIVKVQYDPNTFEVVGYYPDTEDYKEIPEPNIEVAKEIWQGSLGKQMFVIDGIFQEKKETAEQ